MKKTCNGCKALRTSHVIGFDCEFGFRISETKNGYRHVIAPQEECPKPLTYNSYLSEREKISRKATNG